MWTRVIAVLLAASLASPAEAGQRSTSAVTLSRLKTWTGDLDAMLRRRIVRLLTPFSETHFFIDRGRQFGVAAEFALALEEWLNRRHGRAGRHRHLRHHVVIEPMPRDRLLQALNAGLGDIVAANLTITPERAASVDFTRPWITGVEEVVVTGPAAPALASLDDLAGKTVPLRPASSYAAHLRVLSDRLISAGKAPITIQPLPDNLEDEQILDMVNAGLLPFVIVDDHKARLWANVYRRLTIRRDLVVHSGGEIAWAIRKNSPGLRSELDAFLAGHNAGTSFGATIRRRYFGGQRAARPANSPAEAARFGQLVASFRKHGEAVGIDPLLLAAQGFQESRLLQSQRSRSGAVGVMQLLPRTAAAPPVNVPDVASDADANIMAGARYMRHLMDRYVNDAGLDPLNRALLTFAAYNAGPGNLRKFRRMAASMGLDPNIWQNNVEQGAAQVVGRETVQYVANIYKYFVAYDLARENGRTPAAAQAAMAPGRDGPGARDR